jgi:hypothetical protein
MCSIEPISAITNISVVVTLKGSNDRHKQEYERVAGIKFDSNQFGGGRVVVRAMD